MSGTDYLALSEVDKLKALPLMKQYTKNPYHSTCPESGPAAVAHAGIESIISQLRTSIDFMTFENIGPYVANLIDNLVRLLITSPYTVPYYS